MFFDVFAIGQQDGDLTTLGGTTSWCINYCDGCKWLYYMAFVMKVINLENLGRDFPGEWVKADLGLPVSEAAKEELRKEYKQKMLEDNERTKKARTEKVKQRVVEETTHPVFDYGEILVTEKIKVIDYRKIYKIKVIDYRKIYSFLTIMLYLDPHVHPYPNP